jgi:hypothetical protein
MRVMTKLTPPQKSALAVAFDELGPSRIARVCGVKGPSAIKWRSNNRLPRTEWTGETDYASRIAAELGGRVTREQLLAIPIKGSN